MYFAGGCLAMVSLSRIPDIYGRRIFYNVSILISLCLYIGIILNTNVYAMIVLFFFLGLCAGAGVATGFILCMEYTP